MALLPSKSLTSNCAEPSPAAMSMPSHATMKIRLGEVPSVRVWICSDSSCSKSSHQTAMLGRPVPGRQTLEAPGLASPRLRTQSSPTCTWV